jgi:putative hydrolase of the HAD superfamily
LPEIKALFWDVGGVLLTNAWDHTQREAALRNFHVDEKDFAERHELSVSSFERGKITLDEYLNRVLFYKPRPFSPDEFKQFMFSLSEPNEEALAFARQLTNSGKYLMGTINNESRELNQYRIETFGMRAIFTVFVSSCFVGLRKPEETIYQLALDVTQQAAEQCCFIDDRALNLEVAKRLGMHTIEMDDVAQLRADLQKLGVQWT